MNQRISPSQTTTTLQWKLTREMLKTLLLVLICQSPHFLSFQAWLGCSSIQKLLSWSSGSILGHQPNLLLMFNLLLMMSSCMRISRLKISRGSTFLGRLRNWTHLNQALSERVGKRAGSRSRLLVRTQIHLVHFTQHHSRRCGGPQKIPSQSNYTEKHTPLMK